MNSRNKAGIFASIIIAVCIMSPSANALDKAEKLKYCESISEASVSIMSLRQRGTLLSTIVSGIGYEGVNYDIAFVAYEKPLMDSEKEKEKAIVEFANFWYMVCLEALRNQ